MKNNYLKFMIFLKYFLYYRLFPSVPFHGRVITEDTQIGMKQCLLILCFNSNLKVFLLSWTKIEKRTVDGHFHLYGSS